MNSKKFDLLTKLAKILENDSSNNDLVNFKSELENYISSEEDLYRESSDEESFIILDKNGTIYDFSEDIGEFLQLSDKDKAVTSILFLLDEMTLKDLFKYIEKVYKGENYSSTIYSILNLSKTDKKITTIFSSKIIDDGKCYCSIHFVNDLNNSAAIDKKNKENLIKFKKYKILITDDEDLNLTLIESHLKDIFENIEVYKASNGNEAVEIFKREKPNLIFMDVNMPKISGLEATKEIRLLNNLVQPIIIALTGGDKVNDKEDCLSAGMNDFLNKPFTSHSLISILERYVDGVNFKKRECEDNKQKNIDNVHYDERDALRRFLGDKELLDSSIKVFFENVYERYEKLVNAYENKNLSMLKLNIHSFKSSAGNLSFQRLYKLLKNSEIDMKLETISEHLKLIKKEIDLLQNLFKDKY
ncbi:MAG: response regulator [Candidatus Delongbacteria bacterium]|nr:response regulator [Candidatus Delongbacteria bacterium]MBN2833547.1 response regulator [Candidatus Delongbacteria bacterium]